MYELHFNGRSVLFKNEDDLFSAIWLLEGVNDIETNTDQIKDSLNRNSYYENCYISIIKTV